jgi:nucleotide-binding universal stress UspA family protein
MFYKVLVNVEGRDGGHDAMALAKLLRAEGGALTLVNLYRGGHVWRGYGAASELAEQHRAAELLAQAREEASTAVHVSAHGASSVGRGLHKLAEAVKADLLVIGSSPQGVLHRVLVGDDTRAALNGAPCAVAIAPTGFSRDASVLHKIGVGYDGSTESRRALAVAREIASTSDAELSAFEAVAVPTFVAHGRSALDGTSLDELIDEARQRIAELGGVEAHAGYGRPAEELAHYGASLDLLVIGSRGYGPIGRLVHGSTAHDLVRSARCPLLIVPRGARPAGAPATEGGRATGSIGAPA